MPVASAMNKNGYLSFILILTALGICSLYLSLAAESLISLQSEHHALMHKSRFLAPSIDASKSVLTMNTEPFLLTMNTEPIPRPPLASIVNGWNISGDASWLLQFSIVGFPKCGTSTLMHHLRNHPEANIFADERCELGYNQHARLIEDLYNSFPASNSTHRFIRGIKCPADLENTRLALKNYQGFFPKTKMIVGVRHPVLWFESFYNFRVHNLFPMPHPSKLIGRCGKGSWNVCTFRSNFHLFLNNLGIVTNQTAILDHIDKRLHRIVDPHPNPLRRVFFYEISQLSDPEVEPQFRQDLQHFLELSKPIEPLIWFKPGKNHSDSELQSINAQKIDICEHDDVRQVLMLQAVHASRWIRDHFLDVAEISSRSYLERVLSQWDKDPCEERAPSRPR